MKASPTIFITAAEASGDAHAAGLIHALRRRLGDARFVGIGGPAMASAGCELVAEPVKRAAMTTGALAHLGYFHRIIRQTRRAMGEIRPDVHVPVDSPALNWHLAKAARKLQIPVAYYIAPQTWAWAPWRVRKLRKLANAVACILPFEEEYFRKRGVNAHYVGHPLFDDLPPADPQNLTAAASSGQWRLTLMPGSRESEIRHHAPALVKAMDALGERYSQASFTITAINAEAADTICKSTGRDDLPIEVGNTSEVLKRSHFAITASGTVTLQVAHFGVPMVVFYRVGKWPWRLLGRWLIRTPHLSLVNILAGKRLVPELMPWFGDSDELLRPAEKMMGDVAGMEKLQQELTQLVAPLQVSLPGSAADNAARVVLGVMK
jgi:lipid-A-disaccharide synthase